MFIMRHILNRTACRDIYIITYLLEDYILKMCIDSIPKINATTFLFGILKRQFGHKLKIALPKIHPFKITTTVIDFYTF